MKKIKKTLSLVLTLVLLISSVGIGLDTITLNTEVPTAKSVTKVSNAVTTNSITFYVPEAIYLTPAAGDATTFQYYVDRANSVGGAVNTNKDKTTGNVYFYCAEASVNDVSISVIGGDATWGTITKNATTFSSTITGGSVSPGVAQNGIGVLTWTATYTINNKTMTATAYTSCYAPNVEPVGAFSKLKFNGGTQNLQGFAYISGVQGYSISGTTYGTTTGGGVTHTITNYNFNAGVAPLLSAITAPTADNTEQTNWLTSVASGKTGGVNLGESVYPNNSQYYTRVQNSPTGLLTVDTSRYTQIDQVPNLSCGLVMTCRTGLTWGAYYYLSKYDAGTTFITNGGFDGGTNLNNAFKNNGATGTLYVGNTSTYQNATWGIKYGYDNNTNPVTAPLNLYGTTQTATPLTGTGIQSIRLKAAVNYSADSGGNRTFGLVCLVNVAVTKVDKSTLRSNYNSYIALGLQQSEYTPDSWSAYANALSNAATRLGNPTSSNVDTSVLTAARSNLVRKACTATIIHTSTDAKISVNDPIMSFYSGDTITASPNSYPGYSSSTATQIWDGAHANIYYIFYYSPNTCSVTFDPQGGSVTPTSSTVTYNSIYGDGTGGFPTPVKLGNIFDGWFTGMGGTGTQIYAGTAVTTTTAQTLYAKWTARTYMILYSANAIGTTGSTPTSTHFFDISQPLSTNGFVKPGYGFIGWSTTPDPNDLIFTENDLVINLTEVNGGAVVLYAVWNANAYTVSYNGSGATSGFTANSQHYFAAPKNLTINGFYKTGYTFAGWATSEGGPKVYNDGQTVQDLAQSGTFQLYAKWTANTYTIAYNPNGGTGTTMIPSSHTTDSSELLTMNGYTRIGYDFLGWSKDLDATTADYTDGESVSNVPPATGNITFYAVWSINHYTVNFNLNGGTGDAPLTVTQNYATNVILPATTGIVWPTTVGTTAVRFVRGWNSDANADEKLTPYAYAVPADNSTLYMIWGADYTAVLNASNTAGADYLPAANDPRYLPGGDLYASAGFTHGGIYPRSDFTWASVSSLENAVQAVNFTNKKSEQLTLVKGYETAIMTAYGNLVLAPADYSTIEGLILDATTDLNRALYTTDSLVAVDEERANAEESITKGYKKPLQSRVDEKAIALENALNSLVFRGADYSQVLYIWNNRPAFTNYTEASVYDLTYYYEQEVNTTLLISDQAIVDGYAATLIELINALVLKDADYTGVHAALLAIPDMDGDEYFDQEYLETIYSTTSVANLAGKVNAVDWDKDITAQLVVDGYAQAIVTATNALVPKNANYYYLRVALDREPLLPVDYYTAVSYQFYLNKLNAGQNLYDHQTLTILQQSIIDQAILDINDAYAALTPKTVNYTVKYQTTGGTPLAIDVVKTGLAGSQVTETAADITGYTPVQTTMQLDLTGTDSANVIIFRYGINSYTVTFNANGGSSVSPITQNYNTAVAQPTAPTKTGYVFAGWYQGAGLSNPVTWPYTLGASDVTFRAEWTANTYTVMYNSNGGDGGVTANSPHTYDTTSNLTTNGFTKTGNTFMGWATTPGGATEYTDGQSVVNLTPTPGDVITFYAVWKINEYTISFNSDGGTTVDAIRQDYDTSVTAPTDPAKTGYTFVGWLPVVPKNMPAEDVECVAQWTINSYTITWNADGGTGGGTNSCDHFAIPTAIDAGTKTGYTFAGWDPEIETATGPATYTALWTIKSYAITWNADGGDGGGTNSCDHFATPTAIDAGTKTGYTFTGWDPAIETATGPATYTALWSLNSYTFTWNADGGTGGGTNSCDHFATPTAIDAGTKTGYTFTGWSPSIVAATEPATYTAQWSLNSYPITWNADGGTGGGTSSCDHFAQPTAIDAGTKTGYTFAGWDPAIETATGPTTYIALWTAIDYTITWDASGGEGGTTTSEAYGTTPAGPVVTLVGYTFTGWDPEVVSVTGDASYTAQWAVAYVTITFDANGGTGGWSQDLLIGATLTAPVVTRTGYTFDGWDSVVPETVPGVSTTYTAQWTMIPVLVAAEGSTTIINSESNFIYGLEPGISKADFEDLFVEVFGNGRLVVTPYSEFGEFGTGTTVELLDNATDEVLATYYIVIFGDVNGDGFVSTIDGDIVFNVDNWYIEWDIETQPFLFAAADLNGDGFVSTIDGDIIFNVDNWYMYIDQTTGLAYEA